MTVVYVDVLIILNFMINFVLLRAASLFAQRKASVARLILASTFGAVSSLVIFLPFYGVVASGLLKLGIASVMTLIAFEFRTIACLVKDVFCVFAVSFVFSGVMLAIYLALTPYKMSFGNGIVYFDISATALLFVTVACYLTTELLLTLTKRRTPEHSLCELSIYNNGTAVFIPALIDTGSNLIEPFSKAPVIVCAARDIEAVTPDSLKRLKKGEYPQDAFIRMIPFSTLNSVGAIPAFAAQKVAICHNAKTYEVKQQCYIAVADEKLATNYSAIINPELLEQEMVGVTK